MKPTGKYILCVTGRYGGDYWFIYFDYDTSLASEWATSFKDVLTSSLLKSKLPTLDEISTTYTSNLVYLQPINSLETLPQDFPELFL